MPLENSKQGQTGLDIAYNENTHRLPDFGPHQNHHSQWRQLPSNPAATMIIVTNVV